MKKLLYLFSLIFLFAINGQAQVFSGKEANKVIQGAKKVRMTEKSNVPAYVQFQENRQIPAGKFTEWAKKAFQLGDNVDLRKVNSHVDAIGHTHIKYQQTYQGVPIFGAVYIAHVQNDMVYAANGVLVKNFSGSISSGISESGALQAAKDFVGAESYKWEIPEEEAHIKAEQNDPNASFFPNGKLVFIAPDLKFKAENLRLAYRFDIYAHQPVYRADIFVDAQTGEIIFENENIHIADANGTAQTGYSGQRDIITDSFNGGFRLREASRGGGIRTFDMNEGTTYGNATDFTDNDNNWTSTQNLDQYALDAHWGAEMTFDYYLDKHNHSSIDNNDMLILSYIHYDNSYNNAFWDGQRMTYGDGNSNNPLTTVDIVGHELTHGVTDFSADLVYQDESGALNESFSDIFGTTVEAFARPNDWDWLMGGDRGAFCSVSNPGNYGDPDTYFGNNWAPLGGNDNGGVHTNSGVQNKWFYILTEGESGTNDLGDSYAVTGIGMDKAASIAYRNLTTYLTNSSDHSDARFYAIQSAIDLFGACSPEVIATANAWYAVGVGDEFDPTVTSEFEANITSSCEAPFTVEFNNLSSNGGSFQWDFGDGNTSTATNPTHTFTSFGNFDVTLISDGGNCGTETEIKTSYISIDQNNPCIAFMPTSGSGNTQTSCIGTLYDDGGPNNNYMDQGDVTITIAPTGASTVTLDFQSFNFEAGYDYLYVYDGPSTASPLIGQYDGNTLPNGGSITSTGGEITLRQNSDTYVNESGFEINWSCTLPNSPPTPNFTADILETCNGEVSFTDQSINGPTDWLWDFGDGNTSTQQNPTHVYQDEGTYTVTLTVTNNFGNNSVVRNNYVVFDKPTGPNAYDAFRCDPGTLDLSAQGTGTFKWYDAQSGGNLVYTGSNFTTPSLTNSMTYFVELETSPTPQFFGPGDNTFGNGGYFTGDQHLIFDAFSDFTLKSVKVYANGGGNRTIELRDNTGTVIESLTVNIPDGENRVDLDFEIPAGNNYQLGTLQGSEPDLYRNSDGPSYPYTLSNVAEIQTSSAGNEYYYFFYDWEVQEPSCITERTEVLAEIAEAPSATDVSRCGPGTLDLTATGSGTLKWFDASTGGNEVGSGTNFTTPSLISSTTYYVESQVPGPVQNAGAPDNNFGTGSYFNGTQSLIFDAYVDFTLVSVNVYAEGAGNRTFELRDNNGSVLQSATINVPDGENRITLNFDVPTGTDLQLGVDANANLWRNNAGPSYPYTLPGVFSITNSTAGQSYYYTCYDWEIQTAGCSTQRIPVTASIEALPVLQQLADENICDGDNITLTANGTDINTYSWAPGGETTASINVSPNSTETYTVTATNDCGTDEQQMEVTVNPLPEVTASSDQEICAGEVATLNATGSGSFTWSPGQETDPSIQVSPTITTDYIVSSTNNCGSVFDTVQVVVNPLPSQPQISLNGSTLEATAGQSYQWYLDGNPIPGATNQTYQPEQPGDYTVEVFDQNGCSSISEPYTIITVDINENELTDLRIYPNPTNDIFTIQLPNNEKTEIVIYNAVGQVIMSKTVFNSQIQLNAESWSNGIYWINIQSEKVNVTEKLVKN